MDHSERIGTQSILRLLIEFSIPAVVGMLVSALYNVIDRIFIGHSAGELGIAAVTIAFPIMTIQMAFGGLVGMGATANVSIRLGEDDRQGAREIAGTACILLAGLSLLLTISGLAFLKPLLVLFGASARVLPYAEHYMSIILAGTVFQMFSFGLNNMIRAEGKPIIAMATMLIGTVLNAVLAPLYIFVFHWGMYGAALATVCSQFVSAAWIAVHFLKGDSILKIEPGTLRLKTGHAAKILELGLPSFLMQLAQCALAALMNLSLARYGGDIAISGMGIVNSVSTLIVLPIIGVNQGAQPIIGYNYGAQKYPRVKKTLFCTIALATVFSTAGFFLTRVFPRPLVMLFDSSDPKLIAFGCKALLQFMMFLPIVGFQIASSGYFQAVGKPKQSILLSLSRQVLVFIPALLILPAFFKMEGVLAAGPVSDFISTIVTAVCLTVELRNSERRFAENRITIKVPENIGNNC